jgi:hypothetical protein
MNDNIPNRAQVIVAVVASQGAAADEDRRAIVEAPGDVIRGLRLVMKATGATRGIVALPRNRTDLHRRLAQEIIGGCHQLNADIELVRRDQGDAEIGDCHYFSVSVLVEIARAVDEALAAGEEAEAAGRKAVSPVGADYRWLVEQAGGGVHAPYRVMVEGGQGTAKDAK